MLRVTGGELRGRKLFSPRDLSVRPPTDMVRVALFNILGDRIIEANVLDLFAGTGALGIESLSRGAKFCLFVEKERRNCAIIERNLYKLSILPAKTKELLPATVIAADAFDILTISDLSGTMFDVVFVDPPYALSEGTATREILKRLLRDIFSSRVSAQYATMVFRERKGGSLAEEALGEGIEIVRAYGTTKVTIAGKK